MKQWTHTEFCKMAERNGFYYMRHNGSHSIYVNAEGNHISVTSVPSTKVTDLANLTSGYYILKEVNSHKTNGWIKPTQEAVGQNLTKTSTAPVANDFTIETYLWYVEKQEDGTYTISYILKDDADPKHTVRAVWTGEINDPQGTWKE